MKFKESKLAHQYLDGLKGIEIGGAAHNPFGLDTVNCDISESGYKDEQIMMCGEFMKVDYVCSGDDLPFDNKSFDFVISSHVLEHFYDPIKTLLEWKRVARKYIFIIIPHKDRTFDRERRLTTVNELIDRYYGEPDTRDDHWNVWTPENFKELLDFLKFDIELIEDTDDKVGNGFIEIIKL